MDFSADLLSLLRTTSFFFDTLREGPNSVCTNQGLAGAEEAELLVCAGDSGGGGEGKSVDLSVTLDVSEGGGTVAGIVIEGFDDWRDN